MNIEEYRAHCLSFTGVTEDFPFDEDTLVFRVMDKIFALTNVSKFERINIKCDPIKAATLRTLYDEVEPGFHMNKKHWNSVNPQGTLDDEIVKEWINDSYKLVVESLPRKKQRKLEKWEEEGKKPED